MSVILEAREISIRFGGVQALNKVSFHVNHGEVYGLIGPNGAGKTTLFNTMTRLYQPTEGQFVFCGQVLDIKGPHQIAQRGIARTFQNIRLFPALTVIENVMVGRHSRRHTGVWDAVFRTKRARIEARETLELAQHYLDYVGLGDKSYHGATSLPYGEQRRLEIARALASEPKLLALDEPAAGMNPTETSQLAALVEKISADGTTVLLIEHDMKFVMRLCRRILVLNFGCKLIEGEPQEVRSHPEVISAYLGGGHQG